MAKAKKADKAAKVSTFIYAGTDRRGNKVKGEAKGKNAGLVKADLRKQGITAKSVQKKLVIPFLDGVGGKVTTLDICIFTRQLATMMKAGVPLVQSFDIVVDGLENPAMREVVSALKVDVETGGNLAAALMKHPSHFDSLFCNLVDAGEQSGSLDTMLDRVALYKEKSENVKMKIKKALKYPITVLFIAAIVTAILLIKVVPVFAGLFEGMGAELPLMTQYVVIMSDWMVKWWFVCVALIVAIISVFSEAIKRSKKFSDTVDALKLKIPVFGDLIYKGVIARFSRTLATTFAAGVPLIDALTSCAGAAGNSVYYDAIIQVREDVSTGQQLTFAMQATQLFPNMAIQMVSIGEESGSLDAMLDKVAIYYEEEVDQAVEGLTAMMEPMIMAFLGVVIGGLIMAMYLPIFEMGKAV